MALQVITAGYCLLNGTIEISDYANDIKFEFQADEVDTTRHGQSGFKSQLPGLLQGTLTIAGFTDYVNSGLDDVMSALVFARANCAFVIKPVDAATSNANPKWTGEVTPNMWQGLAAPVGDVSKISLTYKTSGSFARAESD